MLFGGTAFDIIGNTTVTAFEDIIDFERQGIGWFLNWLRIIGTAAALIFLTIMAIKYMSSDKPESKKQLKESLPHYILGVIIFIGAVNILYYIEELVTFALSQL